MIEKMNVLEALDMAERRLAADHGAQRRAAGLREAHVFLANLLAIADESAKQLCAMGATATGEALKNAVASCGGRQVFP